MTAYMRVVDGRIGLVFARDDATKMEDEDAKRFMVLATETWHKLVWKIEEVSEHMYIVKAERG
jgi:hypothetical protein